MKTLVTVLKLAMLVTTLSFVMSCDKNNKRSSNNTTTGIYTYGANGTCVNNQTGQQMPVQYCQQQYNNGYGYGTQQCNGNSSLFIWTYADQGCSTQPQMWSPNGQYNTNQQTYYCWKSCATTNCSGQTAYPGGSQSQSQGYQCL